MPTPQELLAKGYTHEHLEESWEDVGGPENGPKLIGHPECDVYALRDHYYVFQDGELVEEGNDPYWNMVLDDQF